MTHSEADNDDTTQPRGVPISRRFRGACPGGEAFRCAGVDRRAFEMLDLGIRPSPLSFSHRRARSPNCLLWHCCLGILSREAAALRRT